MYGKFSNAVSALRTKAAFVSAALMLAIVGLLTTPVFAEGEVDIDIPTQTINWGDLPTKIMTAVSGPIVVAIGIGLAVWIMWVGLKFIRRSIA